MKILRDILVIFLIPIVANAVNYYSSSEPVSIMGQTSLIIVHPDPFFDQKQSARLEIVKLLETNKFNLIEFDKTFALINRNALYLKYDLPEDVFQKKTYLPVDSKLKFVSSMYGVHRLGVDDNSHVVLTGGFFEICYSRALLSLLDNAKGTTYVTIPSKAVYTKICGGEGSAAVTLSSCLDALDDVEFTNFVSEFLNSSSALYREEVPGFDLDDFQVLILRNGHKTTIVGSGPQRVQINISNEY